MIIFQKSKLIYFYIASLFTVACACHAPIILSKQEVNNNGEIRHQTLMPIETTSPVYEGLKHSEIVFQFFRSRDYKMIWSNDTLQGLSESLMSVLDSIKFYGLSKNGYHIDEINTRNNSEEKFPERIDALYADAFISLAMDLRYGRLGTVSKPANVDSLLLQLLEHATSANRIREVLEDQEPVHDGYKFLKTGLHEMLASLDIIQSVPAKAVTEDSILLQKQIQSVEVNMERWRAELPLPMRYIWINIPSYMLQMIDDSRISFESKVIVGKFKNQTPVLSSEIECITIYPYWHVPRKITVEEYLPRIQKDTSFLTLNNFQILDRKGNVVNKDSLHWDRFDKDYFPFTLRQREGVENSLGVIKFTFDNPYAVYLHDTNAKVLFKKNGRALSHGCIRLDRALDLARYFAPDPTVIDTYIKLKQRHTIVLAKAIPIFTRYLTCASINGVLTYYEDVYKKDAAMIKQLYLQDQIIGL
ncbi:MAG: L,D-transpeptidase family protein [Chryseolinea sp.]